MRRFVRLDLNGADPGAGLALDEYAIAAPECSVAGQKIVQMPGLLQADGDDFRELPTAFKRIDVLTHYVLAPPVSINYPALPVRR